MRPIGAVGLRRGYRPFPSVDRVRTTRQLWRLLTAISLGLYGWTAQLLM